MGNKPEGLEITDSFPSLEENVLEEEATILTPYLLEKVLKDDPTFFHLYFEGWAVARQSELVDRKLKSLYGQFREALETCLDDARQRGILSFSIPVKGLAALLTGILDGMGLQLVTEPDLAEDETIWQTMETGIVRLLSE